MASEIKTPFYHPNFYPLPNAPYCPKCKKQPQGFGSILLPFICDCGMWKAKEWKAKIEKITGKSF